MQRSLKVVMAQINPIVGAIEDNTSKICEIINRLQNGSDVIIFPELAITGYPPEDILFRDSLYKRVDAALKKITRITQNCTVILGHPQKVKSARYNAASIISSQKILQTYHKEILPNLGVFDEKRYFQKGNGQNSTFTLKGYKIGICICEDIWQKGPVDKLIEDDVQLIFCINASPFEADKYQTRHDIVTNYAKKGVAIFYVNQVGGQDELVFDGQSFVIDGKGTLCARAEQFQECIHEVTVTNHDIKSEITPLNPHHSQIYKALQTGLYDYVHKNGFEKVVLGLSGGIDSALVLAIAVDTLGPENVHAVMMPSRYTADISNHDAKEMIDNLKVSYTNLSIEPIFSATLKTLEEVFAKCAQDVTEENMQARIRGLLLMSISNKFGYLVVSTSNKSESAVGYTTLYGDMSGGVAVLKDVYKTQVYELAHYRNSLGKVIPDRIITRPASAELAFNQEDEDSLPDYTTLDSIISLYMEHNFAKEDIVKKGFDANTVYKVINLIKKSEYKRRQAPPGIKITTTAFGRDWRYPITSRY